jgi:hypothetical protein
MGDMGAAGAGGCRGCRGCCRVNNSAAFLEQKTFGVFGPGGAFASASKRSIKGHLLLS